MDSSFLDKDTYEYLTNFADDRTILNMLAVNRKFNDDEFFRRVLQRKYSTLLAFKKSNETYKHLFLRMVKVLAILLEKYKIPYIPTKGCNPEILLETGKIGKSKLGYTIYDEALFCAAVGNNVRLVKYLFPLVNSRPYSTAVEHAFNYYAVRNDSFDVMEFLNDKVKHTDEAFDYALRYGKLKLIKFLVENGEKVHRFDIDKAEQAKHFEVADYLNKVIRTQRFPSNSPSNSPPNSP